MLPHIFQSRSIIINFESCLIIISKSKKFEQKSKFSLPIHINKPPNNKADNLKSSSREKYRKFHFLYAKLVHYIPKQNHKIIWRFQFFLIIYSLNYFKYFNFSKKKSLCFLAEKETTEMLVIFAAFYLLIS